MMDKGTQSLDFDLFSAKNDFLQKMVDGKVFRQTILRKSHLPLKDRKYDLRVTLCPGMKDRRVWSR